MNLDEMTLSSPNYPKWYNADGVGCEWLITAPEGFIIALEFNHFHVSNFLDFVKKAIILWGHTQTMWTAKGGGGLVKCPHYLISPIK